MGDSAPNSMSQKRKRGLGKCSSLVLTRIPTCDQNKIDKPDVKLCEDTPNKRVKSTKCAHSLMKDLKHEAKPEMKISDSDDDNKSEDGIDEHNNNSKPGGSDMCKEHTNLNSQQSFTNREVSTVPLQWTKFRKESLKVDYTQLYSQKTANELLTQCERDLSYNEGHLAQVQIFGKWIDIPRKQVAHGDPGLTYSFSGNTVPARPWTPFLCAIRDDISRATGYDYNFILINRYKDGMDYMGMHKDDEKDLFPGHPIASLSLGQSRDFLFKHQDSRGKKAKRKMDSVKIHLQHGSLLLMKHPTNSFWYHSLPRRTKALGLRINMTFRKMERSKCKAIVTD